MLQRIRFWIARWNGKNISTLFLITGIVLFFILPTGDPSDIIAIPFIMVLGAPLFLVVIIVLLIIFFSSKKVRSMVKTPTKNEVGRICKKITNTKSSFRSCISRNGG